MTSDTSITIDSWTDEDEPALLELQRVVSGEDSNLISPEFFDWQYRQNPAGRAFIACAREPGGMIVAQYVTIPVRLRIMGKRVLGSFAVNAATHPDYRRLNLFFRCSTKVFEDQLRAGIAHTFAFPTLYAYLGSTLKMGYRDLGLTHLLMKLHNSKVFLEERGVPHPWLPLGTLGDWVFRALQKESRRVQNVEEVGSFDDLPVEKLTEPGKVVVDVDISWLNWRYVANPKREYRIAVARDSDEMLGVVIHGFQDSGPRKWGIMMDLMLSQAAEIETVESLMHHVFSANTEAGCSLTLCLAPPGSRKEELLKQCGFWTVPKRIRSKGISTGVMLYRNGISFNGSLVLEDIDAAFGMHDVL